MLKYIKIWDSFYTCYSTITCKILLNKPHSKLGQHCAARYLILTRRDTRKRARLALLCAKLTLLNMGLFFSDQEFLLILLISTHVQGLPFIKGMNWKFGIQIQCIQGSSMFLFPCTLTTQRSDRSTELCEQKQVRYQRRLWTSSISIMSVISMHF